MAERLGEIIYWVAIGLAGLTAVIGVLVLFGDKPVFSLVLFIPTVIIWGFGRAVLYVLAGR